METETQHRVVVGRIVHGTVRNEKQIGTCRLLQEGAKPYYHLHLWQYPLQDFYLVKNRDNKQLTLFSSYEEVEENENFEQETLVFRNPVGYGYQTDELGTYIQLQFNFPWQKVFIDLFPENKGGKCA